MSDTNLHFANLLSVNTCIKMKYFRFMTDLTGKKAVSADANKKKAQAQEKNMIA